MRDRRGRGHRGPRLLPGPLSPGGVPAQLTRSQHFDDLVLDVVADLETRWKTELHGVEFGVEEAPWLPEDWRPRAVPLSTLVRGNARSPTRIVVFRLTVQQRAHGPAQLERLVRDVLVARVAELLGRDSDEIDPDP
ncbi:MAG: metallopeptidase family protein [Nocardioidaceae bacterium]|nr:metallopeptidase family protein [Nocardioidaceae bacterium]